MELDRLPPQDIHAEEAVLGSLWLDNMLVPNIAACLEAAEFYSPEHQIVYRAMLALGQQGKPIDEVTLPDALRTADVLERAGGLSWLIGMLEKTPSSANAEYYAAIVREKAQRRKLISLGTDLARKGFDATTPVPDSVAAGQSAIAEVCSSRAVEDDDLEAIAASARAEMEGMAGGLRWNTNIGWLDAITGGLSHEVGWVVKGQSGHCKTAMALNIALGIIGQGGTVCFFRWEEKRETMIHRVASLRCGIPYGEVRRNESTPYDRQKFLDAVTLVGQEYKGWLYVYRGLSLAEIEAAVVRRQPWLCVYDTIQAAAMQVPKSDAKEGFDKHIARLSSAIVKLRGRYRHASLLVSQVNSEGQARESKALKEDNDVMIDIHWPHKRNQRLEQDRIIVRFEKNRTGGIEPVVVSAIVPGTQLFGHSITGDDEFDFLRRAEG